MNRIGKKKKAVSAPEHARAEVELRRADRALRTLSACNQALVRSVTETALLEEICRVIVTGGGYRLVWTGYAEDDEQKTVRPVAGAGYEAGYLEHLSVTWADTERGRGPTGTAIRTGRPAVCRNMLVDPNFAPWRDDACARGYASSIALPLVADGRPFAVLNIYAAEPDTFDAEEVKLLTGLAEDLTYGILGLRARKERQRAEAALHASERQLSLVFAGISDVLFYLAVEPDGGFRFVSVNSAFLKVTGLTEGQIVGKRVEEVIPVSAQPLVLGNYREAIRTKKAVGWEEVSEYPVGKKYGEVTITPVFDADGSCTRLVGIVHDITQRRQVEAALRVSEERFSKAFHLSPLSIAISTLPDGVYREVNDSFLRFTGYTREEVIGRTSVDLKLWVDERVRQKVRKELAAGIELQELPVVLRVSSGALRDTLYSAVTIQLGGVDHVLSLVRDSTERKRAEEALAAERNLLRTLIDSLPDRIYIKDVESRFLLNNIAHLQALGAQSQEEVGGKTDYDFRPRDLADRYFADDQHVIQTGEPLINREEPTVLASGERGWLLVSKVPTRDPEGKITGLMGISRDITERKRAEAHNREQAALLDNANDAIYVTALDCTILYWNKGAERTYGWTGAEVVNRKTTELISPDIAAADALAAILLKQESWSGERWQMTKSGQKVEVLCRLTLVRDEQGQPQAFFAINTDITEKKQLEARFLRAQRLESIGALASGIAHDLNNVLAPIVMAAQLLQDLVKDPAARHLLKTMEASAQRGAAVVKQVLTFARGVEGERVPLEPRHLLRELERLAAETFPKDIRVESDIVADLWPVLGDATQLHQALMNLCINARDAMPGGGVLTLEAANVLLTKEAAEKMPGAQSGSYACLRVTDTGTGIPPEIEEKIFEPFFTTKGAGKGTGLGLSTVLGIVRSHGGFVRVASKVGQGSTFELYLPATTEQVAVNSDSATPWPHAHGEGILVVDDEVAIREVAHHALTNLGYHVITAGGGAEALRIFRERRGEIQLVLTDMMMPEMDGSTLVKALRVLDPAVRIVGITGMSDTAGMSGLKTLALSAMLAKPFTSKKLLAAIRDALPVTAGHDRAVPGGGESRPAPPG